MSLDTRELAKGDEPLPEVLTASLQPLEIVERDEDGDGPAMFNPWTLRLR